MRNSLVRARLAAGEVVYVVKAAYRDPRVVELMGGVGFDCVWKSCGYFSAAILQYRGWQICQSGSGALCGGDPEKPETVGLLGNFMVTQLSEKRVLISDGEIFPGAGYDTPGNLRMAYMEA